MSGVSLIAAMASNRVIGRDNALPWRTLREDLKHFKTLTMGHHLVMGRKTFDSIGRPLPGRTTVVITRRPDFAPEGVLVARSIPEALRLAAGDPEIFIAGGEQIYRQTLPLSGRIYLTRIEKEFAGDTCFPEFDESEWRLVADQPHADGDISFRIQTWDRIQGILTPPAPPGQSQP